MRGGYEFFLGWGTRVGVLLRLSGSTCVHTNRHPKTIWDNGAWNDVVGHFTIEAISRDVCTNFPCDF